MCIIGKISLGPAPGKTLSPLFLDFLFHRRQKSRSVSPLLPLPHPCPIRRGLFHGIMVNKSMSNKTVVGDREFKKNGGSFVRDTCVREKGVYGYGEFKGVTRIGIL